MRLLLITQALDRKDPVLSVYHDWVAEIAKHFDKVTAICLKRGDFDLPKNVNVLSLGKEEGASRIKYVSRLLRYIVRYRKDYDAVFVHMNQEYILLGGIFWKLFGKKIYMWRNHHEGSLLTDIASFFCKNVFCTSKFSYTAKYKKTILMPVGIDTDRFKIQNSKFKIHNSILFLGRIAPVKKPDVLVEALGVLKDKGVSFTASFFGDPLPKDIGYYESLKKLADGYGISDAVTFYAGVPNEDTPKVYMSHEIFVNLSSSGMYDKTIFEAMSSETLTLASNENLRGEIDDRFIFKEGDAIGLAHKLEMVLLVSEYEKLSLGKEMREYVLSYHSLSLMGEKLEAIMKN